MKNSVVLIVMLMASMASAKNLKVSCSSQVSKIQFSASLEDANANLEQISLNIDGMPVNLRDITKGPVYKGDGAFQIKVLYGPRLYASLEMNLKKCTDPFESTGSGIQNAYVGGFVGLHPYQVKCTCSLK